jgi:hypothetical protein
MATLNPKLKTTEEAAPAIKADQDDKSEKTVMFIGRPADEWKEAAADRLMQGADWLAGATSRLSEKLSDVAHNERTRENAAKAVGVVTGAGALLAGQATRIKPVAAYRATADFARRNPKTAVAGGVVAAAALYGAYRAYRASQAELHRNEPASDYR